MANKHSCPATRACEEIMAMKQDTYSYQMRGNTKLKIIQDIIDRQAADTEKEVEQDKWVVAMIDNPTDPEEPIINNLEIKNHLREVEIQKHTDKKADTEDVPQELRGDMLLDQRDYDIISELAPSLPKDFGKIDVARIESETPELIKGLAGATPDDKLPDLDELNHIADTDKKVEIGKPIPRSEALKISKQTLENAEKERLPEPAPDELAKAIESIKADLTAITEFPESATKLAFKSIITINDIIAPLLSRQSVDVEGLAEDIEKMIKHAMFPKNYTKREIECFIHRGEYLKHRTIDVDGIIKQSEKESRELRKAMEVDPEEFRKPMGNNLKPRIIDIEKCARIITTKMTLHRKDIVEKNFYNDIIDIISQYASGYKYEELKKDLAHHTKWEVKYHNDWWKALDEISQLKSQLDKISEYVGGHKWLEDNETPVDCIIRVVGNFIAQNQEYNEEIEHLKAKLKKPQSQLEKIEEAKSTLKEQRPSWEKAVRDMAKGEIEEKDRKE